MSKRTPRVAEFAAGTTTPVIATRVETREGRRVVVQVLKPVTTPTRRSRPHARGGESYTHFHQRQPVR